MDKHRQFNFTDTHFETLRRLVGKHTGIKLADTKKDMIYGRLVRRLRKLDIDSFDAYLTLVQKKDNTELVDFVNSVTTNLTSFFREAHHFDYLKGTILPMLMSRRADTRRIRIWSAGCSTGQEPYSIAMVVRESFSDLSNWDVKILATDIDTNVINTAKEGVYHQDKIDGISKSRLKRWFVKLTGEMADSVKAGPELQELITFRQLNLLHPWPMKGMFDVLFCRNVVIYFDKDTQRVLFDRFADKLNDDGHMFIGHSESLFKVTERFELLGQTMYRKCG